MPKDVGNYVGFTTDGYGYTDGRLPGFWNIFDLARYSRKNLWPKSLAFGGTGGNVADGLEPGNGYAYHTFNSPGTFVTNNLTGEIEILIVAGGGAGGHRIAGGGGAAGVLHGTMPVSASTTYNITVGKGGYGGSGTGQGGSPSDFYLDGASFPSPSNFARAYGGVLGPLSLGILSENFSRYQIVFPGLVVPVHHQFQQRQRTFHPQSRGVESQLLVFPLKLAVKLSSLSLV